MERYDYYQAVKDDIKEYIEDHDITVTAGNREELESSLYDEMFISDSVTGNASGSYYCNAWKAEEAICHNIDLLGEALDEFGGEIDVLKSGAEACDVTIRCYLLGQLLGSVLDELETDDEDSDNEDNI